MENKVILRPASIRDSSELYQLMKQYIVEFYKKPEPDESKLKRLIQQLLDNPDFGMQFVAEENGKLIGFATLYFTFSTLQVKRAAILNDLFVSPDGRGKKVGETLFQACLEYTREQGFAGMSWETAKDNFVAQALYEKMGGKLSEWLVYEIK